MDKNNKSKTPLSDAFAKIKEMGTGWDDVICVCRGLMKDNPCEFKCKEFFDESLTNSIKEKNKILDTDRRDKTQGPF